MKRTFRQFECLVLSFAICLVPILTACVPNFPIPLPPGQESEQVNSIDDLGCFPIGCDLPPGMKELCESFEKGTINWPEKCSDMPGSACQALCEREKAALGLDLPTTVIDAYQVGWTQPIQFDDNFDDGIRSKHGWAWPVMHIEKNGLFRFWYSLNTGVNQFTSTYTRTWNGTEFSEAQLWPFDFPNNSVTDSQGRLHNIEEANQEESHQSLSHVIWDGEKTNIQLLFPGQFYKSELGMLTIDEQDRLHLVFIDVSRGIREIWYTNFSNEQWSQPEKLSHSIHDSWGPSIGIGLNGRIYVTWHEVPSDVFTPGTSAFTLMTVYDGQSWSKPEIIPLNRAWVGLLADRLGKVHLMSEGKYICQDNGKWETPVNIDYPGYPSAFYHWTLDHQNNLHIVWNRLLTQESVLDEEERIRREFFYRIRYADGSWSPVMTFGLWGTSASFEEVHSTIIADKNGVIHIAMAGNFDGLTKLYYLNSGGVIENADLLSIKTMPPQPIRKLKAFPEPEIMALSTSSGWKSAEPVTVVDASWDRIDFDVALDQDGKIHLVWQNWVEDDTEVFYSFYNGSAWSSAENISNSEYFDFQPRIAVDGNNHPHAVWVHAIPGTPTLHYSHYDGNNWSQSIRLSRPITWTLPTYSSEEIGMLVENEEEVVNPAIAAGKGSQVAVGFEQRSIGMANLTSFTINSGKGWKKDQIIAKEFDPWWYSVSWLNLDMDTEGLLHALMLYSGYINPTTWLYSQPEYTFFDGSSWSEPHLLLPLPAPEENTPGAQMAFLPDFEVIDKNNIFVVFSLRRQEREYLPYVWDNENSYVHLMHWNGVSWSEPLRPDTSTAFGPSAADVSVDAQGLAHIAWSKYDSYSGRYWIYYTTFDGQSIGEIIRLWQSDLVGEPMQLIRPKIVVNGQGNITVFFTYEKNGDWQIASIEGIVQ